LPYVTFEQEGDQEYGVHFGVEHLDEVAAIVGAKRRRKYSPKARVQNEAKLALARQKKGAKSFPGRGVCAPRTHANKATQVTLPPDNTGSFCGPDAAPKKGKQP
jgi:hypothetical protein